LETAVGSEPIRSFKKFINTFNKEIEKKDGLIGGFLIDMIN